MNQAQSLLVKGSALAAAAGTLLLSMPSHAQEVNACRSLSRSDVVVIIGAGTADRVNAITQVVQSNNLQGEFCQTRSGRTVWMSNQLDSKTTAVQVFRHFQDAGIARPIKLRTNA